MRYRGISPKMKNQMDKHMENEWKLGLYRMYRSYMSNDVCTSLVRGPVYTLRVSSPLNVGPAFAEASGMMKSFADNYSGSGIVFREGGGGVGIIKVSEARNKNAKLIP